MTGRSEDLIDLGTVPIVGYMTYTLSSREVHLVVSQTRQIERDVETKSNRLISQSMDPIAISLASQSPYGFPIPSHWLGYLKYRYLIVHETALPPQNCTSAVTGAQLTVR